MKKIVLNGYNELIFWSDYASDINTKKTLRDTYKILNSMETRNLTRQTKVRLANIGFRYNEKKFGDAASHDWATRSMQIDIIDSNLLRIGLGQDKPYTARWLEIPIKL